MTNTPAPTSALETVRAVIASETTVETAQRNDAALFTTLATALQTESDAHGTNASAEQQLSSQLSTQAATVTLQASAVLRAADETHTEIVALQALEAVLSGSTPPAA